MLFCPTCANLLLVDKVSGDLRFYCKTCPYIFKVQESFEKKMHLQRKVVDDVLGGEEAWADVDQTTVQGGCPQCSNLKAYFMQIQIRSADEPMTTFYKCAKCAYQWKEN